MEYKARYQQWLTNEYFDEETKKELEAITSDEKEIEDRFYRDLEFGTGGLRSTIGAGTNRMNNYTIRRATQGLANYILKQGEGAKLRGVAIAFDSRHKSPEFAQEAAKVLAGNGIKAYVFESLRATPELSFAVRDKKCIAGIVITASHNPPEYNGYKVYWEDGAQVVGPADDIINEVNSIADFAEVKIIEFEEGKQAGMIEILGQEMDDKYITRVKQEAINTEVIQQMADDFKIVFTPIHGTGNMPVRRVLDELGFKQVYIVKEQEMPDPNFTTVGYPNPEDPKVFKLAIELAKEVGADIIMGTDPDADRVGVVVKNKEGEYVILTGNQTGCLLTEYILSQRAAKGTLPKNGVVIKTIVTSEMTRAIASHYGVEVMDVLTGFKYIGEKVLEFETTGSHEYVFGFEESYGSLAGDYVRDKDAVNACMLVAEMAAYYKSKGLSLYEALIEMYEKYGYYKESLTSITLKGKEGLEKIQSILASFRDKAPESFAGLKVVEARDYKTSETLNLVSGEKENITLPKSNVLYYTLEDGSWLVMRPSGTEPKVKIYFAVKGNTMKDADAKLQKLSTAVVEDIEKLAQ